MKRKARGIAVIICLAIAIANTPEEANAYKDIDAQLLWCEPDNCYDILKVHKHNATKQEIKKQYFKFSRQLHPDKIDRMDEMTEEKKKEASTNFAKLARAYEILSDERRRKDYDYALKYPNDPRNKDMFYRDKYSNQGLKARFSFIFIGIAAIMTVFQWFNDTSVFKSTWLDFKASDVYSRELKTRLKKIRESRIATMKMMKNNKQGGSTSSLNRNDSNSSLNNGTGSEQNAAGGYNKHLISKREKKKLDRNRSKDDDENDILEVENEMKNQLVEQGVLRVPDWKNLAIVVVSKWACVKAKDRSMKVLKKVKEMQEKKKKNEAAENITKND